MNRKNKILVGCLSILLTLTAGYALFSDNITITGTAIAKGEFNYEITTTKGLDSTLKTNELYATMDNYGEVSNLFSFGNEEGVLDSSITNIKNTITYSASFNNEGQSQYFTAKITNTGSIPIALDIYYDFTQNSAVTGNLIMNDGTLFDVTKVTFGLLQGLDNKYDFTHADIVNIRNFGLSLTQLQDIWVPKEVYDELNTQLDSGIDALPIIETGESIYLVFKSQWRSLSLNKNVVGIDITGTNTITLPIKQVTN